LTKISQAVNLLESIIKRKMHQEHRGAHPICRIHNRGKFPTRSSLLSRLWRCKMAKFLTCI